MPIIILGIIVVGGALFLILSKFKPNIGRRLRGGYGGFGFGGFDGLGAMQDGNSPFKMPFGEEEQPPVNPEGDPASTSNKPVIPDRDDSGKVLYVFGSGEREERSLGEDDKQDE